LADRSKPAIMFPPQLASPSGPLKDKPLLLGHRTRSTAAYYSAGRFFFATSFSVAAKHGTFPAERALSMSGPESPLDPQSSKRAVLDRTSPPTASA
jgi:hypothetical protein